VEYTHIEDPQEGGVWERITVLEVRVDGFKVEVINPQMDPRSYPVVMREDFGITIDVGGY
jgi:hypothetical protein